MKNQPEVWLRGPLNHMPALLQPVAHALLQAREEINALVKNFPDELLWKKPAGLASVGFHLQHLSGVLDRLFTYAKARQLTDEQLNYLAMEGKPANVGTDALLEAFNARLDDSLVQLSMVNEQSLTETREVGRARLPSTVIGLYVHSAEHTMRHAGQLLVTVKVLLTRDIS